MIGRRHREGMTLVEVLLAISMVVGLMGGVFAFYSDALGTRDRVMDSVEMVSAERVVMVRLTTELRCAKVYPFIRFGLRGGPEDVEFITTALPGPPAWAGRGLTDDPIPPEHDLQLVGYRLRAIEDEAGDVVVAGLERTCQKVLAAPTAEEGEEIEVDFLTPRIRFLQFRYYDGDNWIESWDGGDLPAAVEVTVGAEPLEEGMEPEDYPHETFRRVIYLPAGGSQGGAGRTGRGGPREGSLGEEGMR